MKTKVCTKCKIEKQVSEFYFSVGLPMAACKECQKEYHSKKFREGIQKNTIINLVEKIDGVIIEEQWVSLKGYEGLYEISSFGRIKSLSRKCVAQDKLLKLQNGQYGYFITTISDINGVQKTYLVHILVAKHFIPNPHNKPEVNHKKGVKKDNRFWELEWNTKKENVTHAFKTGLVSHTGIKNANHKLNENQVLEIFNSLLSNSEIAKKYDIKNNTVLGIKKGKRWRHLTQKSI